MAPIMSVFYDHPLIRSSLCISIFSFYTLSISLCVSDSMGFIFSVFSPQPSWSILYVRGARQFYSKWEGLFCMPISLRFLFWYDMIIVFQLSYSPDPHFFIIILIHPSVPSAAVFPCALGAPFRTSPPLSRFLPPFFFSSFQIPI